MKCHAMTGPKDLPGHECEEDVRGAAWSEDPDRWVVCGLQEESSDHLWRRSWHQLPQPGCASLQGDPWKPQTATWLEYLCSVVVKSKGPVNLQKPLFLICVFKINLINKRKTESIPPCRRSLAMLGEDTFGKRNPLNSCNKYSDLIKCSKSDVGVLNFVMNTVFDIVLNNPSSGEAMSWSLLTGGKASAKGWEFLENGFVCLFVCLFVGSLVCWLVGLLVCWLVGLSVSLVWFVLLFNCCVCLFVCLLVCLFVKAFFVLINSIC